MTWSLLAATQLAAATMATDVLAIAFIAGAALMIGAILYGIFTTRALTFEDEETDKSVADNQATRDAAQKSGELER